MTTPSEQYLLPTEDTGDAILSVTIPNTSHPGERPRCLIVEVFDEKPVKQANGEEILVPHAPYSHEANRFVERRFKHGARVICRKGIYHPIYEVPLSDFSIHLIQKAWTGKKRISEPAKPYFNAIFLREFYADLNAARTAKYKENAEVPTSPWFDEQDRILLERGICLNPYQRTAAYNACHTKAYGFFCDPGTGKTCMMIRKLDFLIDHADPEKEILALVLCPKNVRSNWRSEIEKFSNNAHKMHIIELKGNTPLERLYNCILEINKANGKHLVILSGYETAVQTPKIFETLEFDLCILDESQNISNPGTKRTKTLLEHRARFKNVLIATGTPFRNSPFDIYSQFEFLGEGYSGFDSLNAFKAFYGNYEQGYNGKVVLDGFKNLPLMREKIAKHCFVIRKEEALPFLPKKSFSIKTCDMSAEQAVVYRQVAEELYAQLESYGPEPDSMTVQNMLVQTLRLAEISSGYAKLDSGEITRFDPNPKLDLLVEHLLGDKDEEEDGTLTDPNSKTIVWACFHQNIAVIRARLEMEGIKCVVYHGKLNTEEREYSKNAFNCDPETRVFIGTAASGGVGLNLVGFDPYNPDKYTTNCDNVVYFSNNYSYDKRTQSMERAHRFITRVPVHITDLLCNDSIDYEIRDRLLLKKEMDTSLQNVRSILQSVLARIQK